MSYFGPKYRYRRRLSRVIDPQPTSTDVERIDTTRFFDGVEVFIGAGRRRFVFNRSSTATPGSSVLAPDKGPGRWIEDTGSGGSLVNDDLLDIRDYGADTSKASNTEEIAAAIADASPGETVVIPPGIWTCQIGEPGVDPNLVLVRTDKNFYTPFKLTEDNTQIKLLAGATLRIEASFVPKNEADRILIFALAGGSAGKQPVDGCSITGEGFTSFIQVAATVTAGYNGIITVEGEGQGVRIGNFRIEGAPNGFLINNSDQTTALTVYTDIWCTDWPGDINDLWCRLQGGARYEGGVLWATGANPGQGFYTALDRPFHRIKGIHFKDLLTDRPIDFRGSSGTSHNESFVEDCWFENCSYIQMGFHTGASYDRISVLNCRCTGGDGGVRATNAHGLTIQAMLEDGCDLDLRGCSEVLLDVQIFNGKFDLSEDLNEVPCRNVAGTVQVVGAPSQVPASGNVIDIKSCDGGDLEFLCSGINDDDNLRWMKITEASGSGGVIRDLSITGRFNVDAGEGSGLPLIIIGKVQHVQFHDTSFRHGGSSGDGLNLGVSGATSGDQVIIKDCDFFLEGVPINLTGSFEGELWVHDNRQHATPHTSPGLDFGGGASARVYHWNNHWKCNVIDSSSVVSLSRNADGNANETS